MLCGEMRGVIWRGVTYRGGSSRGARGGSFNRREGGRILDERGVI